MVRGFTVGAAQSKQVANPIREHAKIAAEGGPVFKDVADFATESAQRGQQGTQMVDQLRMLFMGGRDRSRTALGRLAAFEDKVGSHAKVWAWQVKDSSDADVKAAAGAFVQEGASLEEDLKILGAHDKKGDRIVELLETLAMELVDYASTSGNLAERMQQHMGRLGEVAVEGDRYAGQL